MNYKWIALFLALTVASWAQTPTPAAPAAPQQDNAAAEKSACPCCEKMAPAEGKDPHACAHHDMAAMDGKEPMSCMGKKAANEKEKASCCNGKDAMSCARSKDKASAASCCGDECGKEGQKDCCSSDKKDETAAMGCCSKQCAAHSAAGASK